MKEVPHASEKQSLVSRNVICTISDFPKIMRRSRGQQGKCARPVLLSLLSSGRLSPMNQSRRSSFATANAPEADLGSKEDGGDMQASLQCNILRMQARHCCRVTAKYEESSPTVSGSSGLQKSCATQANRVMVHLQHAQGDNLIRNDQSKLPASPPPLPRPDGRGNPWPCTCVHGSKKPSRQSTKSRKLQLWKTKVFCTSGLHALSSQQ